MCLRTLAVSETGLKGRAVTLKTWQDLLDGPDQSEFQVRLRTLKLTLPRLVVFCKQVCRPSASVLLSLSFCFLIHSFSVFFPFLFLSFSLFLSLFFLCMFSTLPSIHLFHHIFPFSFSLFFLSFFLSSLLLRWQLISEAQGIGSLTAQDHSLPDLGTDLLPRSAALAVWECSERQGENRYKDILPCQSHNYI